MYRSLARVSPTMIPSAVFAARRAGQRRAERLAHFSRVIIRPYPPPPFAATASWSHVP